MYSLKYHYLLIAVLLDLIFSYHCPAGELVLSDGAILSGSVQLDKNSILLAQPEGTSRHPLSTIKKARFDLLTDHQSQQGLYGEYFPNDGKWAPLCAARIDPEINFDWGSDQPDPMVPPDFSARWTGFILPPLSETYTFEFDVDDYAKIWIDGKLIASSWPGQNIGRSGKIDLKAGRQVPIKVEFHDITGPALLRLVWSSPSLLREIIPSNRLFPATQPTQPTGETEDQKKIPHGVEGGFSLNPDWNAPQNLPALFPQINFDFGAAAPVPMGNEAFAATFSTRLRAPFTGKFLIELENPNTDAALELNGKRIFEAGNCRATVQLEAGKLYDLRLNYRKNGDPGSLRLLWTSTHLPRQSIPPEYFYLPQTALSQFPSVIVTYFSDKGFSSPILQTAARNINLEVYNGRDINPRIPEIFTARFQSTLKIDNDDAYTFSLRHDDGATVWIDGKSVFENKNYSQNEELFKVTLTKGLHPLRIDLTNVASNAACILSWASGRIPKQIIPPEAFAIVTECRPNNLRDLQTLYSDKPFTFRLGGGLPSDAIWTLFCDAVPLETRAMKPVPAATTSSATIPATRVTSPAVLDSFDFLWDHPLPGRHILQFLANDKQGKTLAASRNITVNILDRHQVNLPASQGVWNFESTSPAVVQFKDNQYQIKALPGILSDRRDAGSVILQPVSGDFDAVIHLLNIQDAGQDTLAMAGLTVRESLESSARHVSLLKQENNDVMSLLRSIRQWDPSISPPEQINSPWLRIRRYRNLVETSVSTDGNNWRPLNVYTIKLPDTVYVGPVACAGQVDIPIHANFEKFSIQPLQQPPLFVTPGVMLRDGSLIAGQINLNENKNGFSLRRPGAVDLLIPKDHIAMLICQPMPLWQPLKRDRIGVLLTSGDFAEGEVTQANAGQVTISSIIMGVIRFDPRQIAAIQFASTQTSAVSWQVRLEDGSELNCSGLQSEPSFLKLTTTNGINLEFPSDLIQSISFVSGQGN